MQGNYINRNLAEWPTLPANITDLRLDNNHLNEIPDTVRNLTNLKRIIISNNNITKISPELAKLAHFEDLRIPQNKLKKVPRTIFHLERLKILILNHNELTSLPSEVENLKNINQLHLQQNQIEKLPPEIGKLSELTHLYLNNNPISYLPHSLKNLRKLQLLDIRGTQLPQPSGFNPSQVQKTLDYILENQEEPIPELSIKKADIFLNFSLPELVSKYEEAFKSFNAEYDVEFNVLLDASEITNEASFLLIVVGFDIHELASEVFKIIEKCKENNIPYKILLQKDVSSVGEINLVKGNEVESLRDKLVKDFNDQLIQFNSTTDLKDMIFNVLREHRPEIILKRLELSNIGHFESSSINFDNSLTCIVGENGQGKSSILRALALAITGRDDSKYADEKTLRKLLRIEEINEDGDAIYSTSGRIKLEYTVDGENFENIIDLESEDEGRIINIKCSGDKEINSGEFNLKSLIIGFPQARGTYNHSVVINKKSYSQPHVDDLLPLITFKEDDRLNSFVDWIANLYGEAIKKGKIETTREGNIIQYVFQVISDLTGSQIKFKTVQKFSPPVIIVSSPDAPRGIPLDFISQGFKIVIGWIGYFIQRRFEAFPLSKPRSNYLEKGILIIDEIDNSIHPVWQKRLLDVLRDNFPNTQIICTTHSPLMVAGLDRSQIMEIHQSEDLFSIEPNEFDTWAASYRDILKYVFNTSDFIPKISKEEIKRKIEQTNSPTKKEKLKVTLERLLENETLMDDVRKYEEELRMKEQELNILIKEYRNKI
ncbi:AAA family ATPase [Salinimicrobium sp. WS361]|uniref:AAA family ATPase n=1 Tax=Salinimicrobium sp. WS361 TaxID=3425123 RepID=UPI003D6E3117